MTREEQYTIAAELCDRVLQHIKDALAHKATIDWDGHELRVYLADCFNESARMSLIRREPRSKRSREYKNAILYL